MGREIRRVPPGWEHPQDDRTGRYKPVYDNDYESAAREWIADLMAWEAGENVLPSGTDITTSREYCGYYWEYAGSPPDEEYYRRAWTADKATCYQVYETVSEGTPVSPVFDSLDTLVEWLVNEAGYSRAAAEQFAKNGWVMSAAFVVRSDGTGEFASDIEALALLPPRRD